MQQALGGELAACRYSCCLRKLVGDEGIEPSFHDYESHTFTIKLIPFFI